MISFSGSRNLNTTRGEYVAAKKKKGGKKKKR
jgi:hypothetical protein